MAQPYNELAFIIERGAELKLLFAEIDGAYLQHKLTGAPFNVGDLAYRAFKAAMTIELAGTQIIFRGGNDYRIHVQPQMLIAAEAFDKLARYFPIDIIKGFDGQIHPAVHAALCYCVCLNPQNAITVINRLRNNVSLNDFEAVSLTKNDALLQLMIFNLLGRRIKWAQNAAVNLLSLTKINDDELTVHNLAQAIYALSEFLIHGHDYSQAINASWSHLNEVNIQSQDALYTFITQALYLVFYQMFEYSVWRHLDMDRQYMEYLVNRKGVYELWQSQLDAVKAGCLDESNFVVSLPTSSGKTLLAELRTIKHLISSPNKVVYIAPTKALGQQVLRSVKPGIEAIGKKASLVMNIAEKLDSDAYSKADFVIITPEKLELMIRNDSEILSSIGLVVIDEFHNIGQDERGLKLEFLLWRLKKLEYVSFFILSAVISNSEEIASWISGAAVQLYWRPTKIVHGYSIKGSNNVILSGLNRALEIPSIRKISYTTTLAAAFRNIGGVIVIDMTKEWVENKAGEFLVLAQRGDYLARGVELSEQLKLICGDQHPIVEMVKYGFAYHHADLEGEVKVLIERAMKRGVINLLFATTTLAEGVDFPVTTVIINSLFQSGQQISHRLLGNIAGRAGRAGHVNEGYAIFNCPEKWSDQKAQEFWRAEDEPIYSVLSNVAKMKDKPETHLFKFTKQKGRFVKVPDEAKIEWLDRILSTLESYIWTLIKEGVISDDEESIDQLLAELFITSPDVDASVKASLKRWMIERKEYVQATAIPDEAQNILICTGFSFVSSQKIYDSVIDYVQSNDVIRLNNQLLEWFVNLALNIDEVKPRKKHKDVDHIGILQEWVLAENTDISRFFGPGSRLKQAEYISTQIRFSFAWLAFAVGKILEKIDHRQLELYVQYLADFVRWGTINPVLIHFYEYGFDKDTAKMVANYYQNAITGNKAEDSLAFVLWAGFMDFEELLRNIDIKNYAVRKQLVNTLLDMDDNSQVES
jgi:hypothetical protein